MQEIKITEQEAGQRFDKLLCKYLNKAPKSFLYKMLRKKNITLNGKKASGNEKLAKGDCVKLFLSDETIQKFSEAFSGYTNVSLDILYEDADILVRDKAAFHQADAEQISNPFGVFGIILVAFYSFDPFGIGDDDPDASLLQDIKGRNPILPSGLYTNIHAVVLMEPVGKAVQVRIEH